MMQASILIERLIGQTRAIAIADDGRPVSAFLDHDHDKTARWGAVSDARIRSIAADQGGAFAELESGEEVFIPSKRLGKRTEGAALKVKISAEARRDKLARAEPSNGTEERSAIERWIAALPFEPTSIDTVDAPDDAVEAAFDEILSETVSIAGGGRLHFAETPALLAIDIDTAGRHGKGRASDRAFETNRAALLEIARQLSLRALGGLVVIDCIGPIPRERGAALKKVLGDRFKVMDARKLAALAPSPFGLLEATLPYQKEIRTKLVSVHGQPTEDAQILSALRDLERAAVTDRTARLRLSLPETWSFPALDKDVNLSARLGEKYGARLSIVDAAIDAPQLAPHDR